MSDMDTTAKSGASKDENSVLDKYKDHFALASKGKGCSGELRGKICIVGFLVHDRSSAWKDEEVQQMKNVLQKAAFKIKEQSGLSDNRLQVSYAFDSIPLQYKYERENYTRVVNDVLEQYGFKDAALYQAHYKKKFKKDETPLIYFINRDFRSFALENESAVPDLGEEFSFVSYSSDPDNCVRVLIHELLHQFGAIDYYLPERVKDVAQKLFPESIMLHGMEIDELTRYLIGWDKTPSEKAIEFLEETADVTEEEITEARERDKDNDW